MFVVQVVVAVGIVLATVLVAGGRGDGLSPVDVERRRPMLPADRRLDADDLDAVRLGVGFRGYRMDEVDELVDRVVLELAERDERILELERMRRVAAVRPMTETGAAARPADALVKGAGFAAGPSGAAAEPTDAPHPAAAPDVRASTDG